MRKELEWRKLNDRQKHSRVKMQLNVIESEVVADVREGGPCTPALIAKWMRTKADNIERRNGAPKRRAPRRKLEVPCEIMGAGSEA
jgi:hypothetical protein